MVYLKRIISGRKHVGMTWNRKLGLLMLLVLLGSVHLFMLSILQSYTPLLIKDLFPPLQMTFGNFQVSQTVGVHVVPRDEYIQYKVGNINVNLTVVTAFFDIGDFVKGQRLMTRKLYAEWAGAFAYMVNPLVVYTDSKTFYNYVKNLRANLTRITKLFLVKRTNLWSFSILSKIDKIYRQKDYPRFYPNTIKPAYTSAQHAKYELVGDTIRHNFFRTEFYCWLDFAYFREIHKEKYNFVVVAPPNLNASRVGFTEVFSADMNLNFEDIVLTNKIWLGGGMFVGRKDVLLSLEKEYKFAVHYLLEENLMNTDQQVLYVMYSTMGRLILKPVTKLQVYPAKKNWFRLGYLCYRRLRH